MNFLKKLACTPFVALVIVASFAHQVTAQCTVSCTLFWSDEFSGNSLDLSNWEYQYGNGSGYGIWEWGNQEDQYYTDTQTTVAGGLLTITAEKVTPSPQSGNYEYISSRIRSKGKLDTVYGRYEVRAKLPANQGVPGGQGTWPAVWLLHSDSTYGAWPYSGEIDIMEWLGQEPTKIYGTLHYNAGGGNSANNGGEYFLSGSETNDFHEYAVEWTPNEIRWYVDDILHHTIAAATWSQQYAGSSTAPFDTPFHWIMNVAIGGHPDFAGDPHPNSVYPQQLVVDYVRHYELSGTPTIDGTPTTPRFVYDDFEHNDPYGNWFIFNNGQGGGGGFNNNEFDVPPQNGGTYALNTGWSLGGSNPSDGYMGGFGRTRFLDVESDMTTFSFWINPTVVGQDYTLAINLQDDDNNDGSFNPADDDEFEFKCRISAATNDPDHCAVPGNGWQLVKIPIASFAHKPSTGPQENPGVLDTTPPTNGVIVNVVAVVFSNNGQDANFLSDYWIFEGDPVVEPPASENVPLPWFALIAMATGLLGIGARARVARRS